MNLPLLSFVSHSFSSRLHRWWFVVRVAWLPCETRWHHFQQTHFSSYSLLEMLHNVSVRNQLGKKHHAKCYDMPTFHWSIVGCTFGRAFYRILHFVWSKHRHAFHAVLRLKWCVLDLKWMNMECTGLKMDQYGVYWTENGWIWSVLAKDVSTN